MVACAFGIVEVAPLITRSEAPDAKDNVVPPGSVTVPPAVSVWPLIRYDEPELAVYVVPAMVKTGASVWLPLEPNVCVTPLMTTPEPLLASEIVVPDTVMTPPGVRILPPMSYVEPPLGAYAVPPTVTSGAAVMPGGESA